MLLMIDNYDSFTYNLVQSFGQLGAELQVYRNDEIAVSDIAPKHPKAIILSPGPCTPNEAGICLEVVKTFSGKIPILGVCLGHQTIGQVFGGKVIRAQNVMHGKTSMMHHDAKTIFKDLPNPFEATRYHSLIVEKTTLPNCLEVSAWTEQGEIMGLRHKEFLVEGVQFHPESILTKCGLQILKNFLNMLV